MCASSGFHVSLTLLYTFWFLRWLNVLPEADICCFTTMINVVCSMSFVLISCCVRESHSHLCPYCNVRPEAVCCCVTRTIFLPNFLLHICFIIVIGLYPSHLALNLLVSEVANVLPEVLRCRDWVAEDCCMLSLLLAVPSCIYRFWHGVIPTSYFKRRPLLALLVHRNQYPRNHIALGAAFAILNVTGRSSTIASRGSGRSSAS